jgi:hypothetical protein
MAHRKWLVWVSVAVAVISLTLIFRPVSADPTTDITGWVESGRECNGAYPGYLA